MKFKKVLAVSAIVTLTGAAAVPAMALENEFHGMFRVRGIVSNFDDAGVNNAMTANKTDLSHDPGTKSYVEQRARIAYTAKANDDLKLVTHFEIDSRWGDTSYNLISGVTRNNGGAVGADQVNLETKNVYLDFNVPSTFMNVKAGIQGYMDSYKGIVFSNDAAGAVATAKLDNGSVALAYFRFNDGPNNSGGTVEQGTNGKLSAGVPAGLLTRDFLSLDGKYNVDKDIKVGATYFLLYDDRYRNEGIATTKVNVHMVGVNASAVVGPATVDGFALYQFGKLATGQKVNAFAANAGAKVAAGPGTLRFNALYLSGDKTPGSGDTRNDFQTIMETNTNGGHTFYASEMVILLRNKYTTASTDKAIVYDLNDGAQGFGGAFLGYDLPIDKFFVNSNVGAAMVAKNNTAATHAQGKYIGTEVNTEIGYKLYDNMTASVQAAYLVLGDYFNHGGGGGSTLQNPYTTRFMINYTF